MTSKINKQRIRDDFSQAANSYDAAAIVQHEICDRTLERVDMLKLQPATILDIGTGTGRSLLGLRSRFPASSIFACDIALPMLHQCRENLVIKDARRLICNDAELLPIADESIDLIFSTSTFQWCADLNQVLSECKRVLCLNGALIFSTFGPDTLLQLRNSWAQVDDRQHVHDFMDMHHIGDMMLAMQLLDPVVDMQIIDIHYQSLRQLLQDLKDTGSRGKFTTSESNKSPGLMSKEKYQRLVQAYEEYREDGSLPVSYEVIYGYARKSANIQKAGKDNEVRIPVSSIKKA